MTLEQTSKRDPARAFSLQRVLPTAALAVLLFVGLNACGGNEEEEAGSGGPGFPATVEHEFGTTTVPEDPERVVTVGFNDGDFALALGVVPVATREWFGEQPDATWPWAQDDLGDASPEVLPAEELNFEQIAALQPDLILGVHSDIDQDDYDRLSAIAPTVVQSGEHPDFGVPWQEQMRLTGAALGRAEEAEQVVRDVEAQIADAAADHPEFADATGLFAYRNDGGGYGAYGSADPRARFLEALGFQTPDGIDELAGEAFFADVSSERLDLIDEDVLVLIDIAALAADRAELLDDPLFARLDAVRDGRDVYPDAETAAALSFSTPLSLPAAIDGIVPDLAAAAEKADGGGGA